MTIHKFTAPQSTQDRVSDLGRIVAIQVKTKAFTALVTVATHTAFPVLRWLLQRKISQGETIWLEDMPGPPQSQQFPELPIQPADLTPNPGLKRKRARQMKVDYPETGYPFAYRTPPISGNVINGLGETMQRKANHVFFGESSRRAWGKLDWYFQVMEPTSIHRQIAQIFWQDSNRIGLVAPRKSAPEKPEDAAAFIKAAARNFGAALVGITRMQPRFCYHDSAPDFHYAISVAWPMDRDEMLYTPSPRSNREIMDAYREVNRIAITLAGTIRSLGYPAQASTNLAPGSSTEVLHIPIAIAAGLGQLGKHGSLITAEFGSNVRLALRLARTVIYPAVSAYLGELAGSLQEQEAIGLQPSKAIAQQIAGLNQQLVDRANALEAALGSAPHGAEAHMRHCADQLMPLMGELRAAADALEALVDDAAWPLPTYQEMLFVR